MRTPAPADHILPTGRLFQRFSRLESHEHVLLNLLPVHVFTYAPGAEVPSA
ncbi:hypothetical protein [Hymenobacter jeollabukensis]|uniref:hypothetical protein n=1 Tax=Hymenobacter jeollabukensis TaxID=2025313 RepID=UPI00148517AC|nr:hypothetical protein [Hymenobacter jeollabukensis]